MQMIACSNKKLKKALSLHTSIAYSGQAVWKGIPIGCQVRLRLGKTTLGFDQPRNPSLMVSVAYRKSCCLLSFAARQVKEGGDKRICGEKPAKKRLASRDVLLVPDNGRLFLPHPHQRAWHTSYFK
jgi:hypothetical protein